MRSSKLARRMLKVLPVLAVLTATAAGLFIGKDLYPPLLDSQSRTPAQLRAETNNLQPPIIMGEESPCGLSNIYTSLPPKCRTSDGKFIPLPGAPLNRFVVPERK